MVQTCYVKLTGSDRYFSVLSAAHKGLRNVSCSSALPRKVSLMHGDGIGPEVASAVQHIIAEAGVSIEED